MNILKKIEKVFENEKNNLVNQTKLNKEKKIYMFKEFQDYMNFKHIKEQGNFKEDCPSGIETELGLFTHIVLYPKEKDIFVYSLIHFDFDEEPGHFGKLWQMVGKQLDNQAKQFEYNEGKKFGKYTGKLLGKSTSSDINEEIVEMINKVKQEGHWVIFNKKFYDDYIGRFAVFLGPFETSIGTIEYLKFAFEDVEECFMTKLLIGFSTKKLFQN